MISDTYVIFAIDIRNGLSAVHGNDIYAALNELAQIVKQSYPISHISALGLYLVKGELCKALYEIQNPYRSGVALNLALTDIKKNVQFPNRYWKPLAMKLSTDLKQIYHQKRSSSDSNKIMVYLVIISYNSEKLDFLKHIDTMIDHCRRLPIHKIVVLKGQSSPNCKIVRDRVHEQSFSSSDELTFLLKCLLLNKDVPAVLRLSDEMIIKCSMSPSTTSFSMPLDKESWISFLIEISNIRKWQRQTAIEFASMATMKRSGLSVDTLYGSPWRLSSSDDVHVRTLIQYLASDDLVLICRQLYSIKELLDFVVLIPIPEKLFFLVRRLVISPMCMPRSFPLQRNQISANSVNLLEGIPIFSQDSNL